VCGCGCARRRDPVRNLRDFFAKSTVIRGVEWTISADEPLIFYD
jgi:hypothetical protein